MGMRPRDQGAWGQCGLRPLFLGAAIASLVAGAAQGQIAPVVEPVQDLRFEVLGVGGDNIPVRDSFRRAEWLVHGAGPVELHCVLPEVLEAGESASRIPLEFVYGDLAYLLPGSTDPVFVHPGTPFTLNLPEGGHAVRVLLGGTARSTGEELAGDYQAPVVLLVSQSGATQ